MAFLIEQIKEQKILEMEVVLDDFIKKHGISEKSMIHTMVFDKTVFVKEEEVREYLKTVIFSWHPNIHEDGDSWIAQLVSASQMDMDTQIEVELRRGIVAFAADLMPVALAGELLFNDKGEINLATKIDSKIINLSEGMPYIIELVRVAEGVHPSYGPLKITEQHLESFENNFRAKVTGVDLAVNEDHKKNEAFGWLKDVYRSFDKQVLYGQVEWNKKGIQALSEKEYRYFSPEFRFNYSNPLDPEKFDHGPTLLGGALTNYPFLKMDAITELSMKTNNKQEGTNVTTETINLSDHNKEVVELNGKINTVQIDLNAKIAEIANQTAKIKELEDSINLSTKKQAHQKLFDAHKINAAQLEAMNAGKGMLEIMNLSEKINDKAQGKDGNSNSNEVQLSDSAKGVAESMGLTEDEYKAVEL